LGLKLLASPVDSQKGVPAALRSMLGTIDALWMVPDETVVTPEAFEFLLLAAFENNLPFLAASDIFVEVGAFASLSPDYADVGRQACQLVREIESGRLKLTKVDIVPPAKVNLAINLKTASKIGLTLPLEVIQSASKVYR
jgi:putative ABC transport system substrate-binding protein